MALCKIASGEILLELTLQAAKKVEANLLIHLSIGMTKSGDVECYVCVRCYQKLLPRSRRTAALPFALRLRLTMPSAKRSGR